MKVILKLMRGANEFKLFCSTSLPLTSTRWFDQHFSSFPHSKCRRLISATFRMTLFRKTVGNSENRTRGCWVRSANATSVLCRPPRIQTFDIVLISRPFYQEDSEVVFLHQYVRQQVLCPSCKRSRDFIFCKTTLLKFGLHKYINKEDNKQYIIMLTIV